MKNCLNDHYSIIESMLVYKIEHAMGFSLNYIDYKDKPNMDITFNDCFVLATHKNTNSGPRHVAVYKKIDIGGYYIGGYSCLHVSFSLNDCLDYLNSRTFLNQLPDRGSNGA